MATPEPKICFNAGGKRVYGSCDRVEITAGMFPSRAELLCPVHEFEKLGKRNLTLPIRGDVELYLRDAKNPDVVLKNWFITDAENTLRGQRPTDNANRVIEKRLILMDRRWEFSEGLGGHVFSGTWNKQDADGKTIVARTVLPLESHETEKTSTEKGEPATTFTILKHLIGEIQFASNAKDDGYHNRTISTLLDLLPRQFHDKTDYPVNLELDGAHIPTVIQDILDDKGGVWILHADGTYSIDLIGSTPAKYQPKISDRYRLPNDAVAKPQKSYVVVTSAPNRAAYQEVVYGFGQAPNSSKKVDVWLEAVALDPKTAKWTKLSELSFMQGKTTVIKAVKKKGPLPRSRYHGKKTIVTPGKSIAKVIEEFDITRPPEDDNTGDLTRQFNCIKTWFHHFMLMGPGVSRVLPILKSIYNNSEYEGPSIPPLVEAKCIYPDHAAGGLVYNDSKWIIPEPYDIDEVKGLLSFQWPLIQIKKFWNKNVIVAPFWHNYYEDIPVQIRFTFAHEDRRTGTHEDFFCAAYSNHSGSVQDYPVDAALSPSASCRILKRPDLIEYRGEPDATGTVNKSLNLDELKKIARPMAEAALRQVYDPAARRVYAGLWPVECSGMVPHVTWDLQTLTTTFDFQTWYVPNRYNEKRDVFKQKRKAEKAETTAAAAPAKATHGYEGFSNTPTHVPGPPMVSGVHEILAMVSKATEIEDALTGPDDPDTETPTCVEWLYSIEEVIETIIDGELTVETKDGGTVLTDCVFNRTEFGNRLVTAGGYFGNGVAWNQLDDEAGDYGPPYIGRLQPIPVGAIVKVTIITGTLTSEGEAVPCGTFSKDNEATGVCL